MTTPGNGGRSLGNLDAYDRALCLGCNYDLQNLPTPRCPECGRPFDPGDSTTFNVSRPLTWADRVLLRPIGVLTFGVVGLLCASLLWLAIKPEIYYVLVHVVLIGLLWTAVGSLWYVRTVLRDVVVRGAVPYPADHRWRWACAVVGVTSLLVLFHAPLWIAFLVARPGLEKLAAEIRSGASTAPIPPRRIGPYTVSRSIYGNKDILFLSVGGGGFAYNPNRIEPLGGHYNSGSDGHLIGPWYWWVDD